MRPTKTHTVSDALTWPLTVKEAASLQSALAREVRLVPLTGRPRYAAALDAAFTGSFTVGVAVLFDLRRLKVTEYAHCTLPTRFPYIPGYLSFREGPALVGAIQRLTTAPDILICDGQGIAHPKRLGIASHLGVLLDLPSIGCAKSRLVGNFTEPSTEAGTWSPLMIDGEPVGAVLRSRKGVRPLFVSSGHLITLGESLRIVLACTRDYRLPEPLRAADRLSKELRNKMTQASPAPRRVPE